MVNFFGSGDCNSAKRLIERKKRKLGNMKIEKVGNVKCIGFDYKKKFIASQLIRFKAKKSSKTVLQLGSPLVPQKR